MKSVKGEVGIEVVGRMIRLRLPRSASSTRYISLGIPDTPENRKLAQQTAWTIETDIKSGNLDLSLGKYKLLVHPKPTQALLVPSVQELWQMYQEYKKPSLAETTYYQEYCQRFARCISACPIKDTSKAKDIRDWLVANRSLHTAKALLRHLSAACELAGITNYFQGLVESIKTPKPRSIDPFTPAERYLIVTGIHKHYKNFTQFLFLTGCRPGEAVGLRWQSIAPDYSYIIFSESYGHGNRKPTKTNVVRRFPCNSSLAGVLRGLEPGGNLTPVFRAVKGGIINWKEYREEVWARCLDLAGVRYRCPYQTRHTFITECLEAGITAQQVALWVGNSPEVIYRHYAGTISSPDVPDLRSWEPRKANPSKP